MYMNNATPKDTLELKWVLLLRCNLLSKGEVYKYLQIWFNHRVDRLFFSSRPNWVSPTPSPAGESVPPPFGSGGELYTLAGGRGGGGDPTSDEGTDTVVL